MVNIFKAIAHLRKVGFKEFGKEFKEKGEEVAQDPLAALRLQSNGHTGVIMFSLVCMVIFFWKGMWYISGIFFFNCLVMSGQLLSTRNQIKMFNDMKAEEKKLIDEAENGLL